MVNILFFLFKVKNKLLSVFIEKGTLDGIIRFCHLNPKDVEQILSYLILADERVLEEKRTNLTKEQGQGKLD